MVAQTLPAWQIENLYVLETKYKTSQRKLEKKRVRDIGGFRLGSMADITSVTKSTYLQAFHFRVVSRIISTNRFLHLIGVSDSNACSFCSSSIETLCHLFWKCPEVQNYIKKVLSISKRFFKIECQLNKKKWFFQT